MATNVFVSFDHDDQNQVGGFKSLINNANHPLDFHDRSLREPVTGRSGKPLKYPPEDSRSGPVRAEIISKFKNASKLVVLIGDETYRSNWVQWEINTFYNLKQPISGDHTWKRIRGMKLKGSENATIPRALGSKSTVCIEWDPTTLDRWIEQNPDQ